MRALANAIFIVLAFPAALLCAFGRLPRAFDFFAQSFALAPALPGDYLRAAFYWMTLDHASLYARVSFGSYFANPQVHLGRGVYIGAYCVLGSCRIGEHTLIASGVQILSGRRQHPRRDDGSLETNTQLRPITVGAHCWIGAAAIVMEDVADGSTVAAGAVVTHPVPAGATVAGCPARPLASQASR